ncbi:MAG: winged helix-turn-helix domain-containing protein [Candidatus Pacearchaeota archaeon]|jgi:predicted transcriptional regulator
MIKRGKLEIIKDILKIIQDNKNSIKPTPLLRRSGLSSLRFKEYYSDLLNRKLIMEISDGTKDKYVVLTDRGFRFLERYRSIVEFIDEFDL